MAGGPSMAEPRSFSKIHIGVITSRFTNTFTAIMAPDWERVINRLDGLIASMMRMFSSTTAERHSSLEKWPHSSKQRRLRGARKQGRGNHDLTLTIAYLFWRQVIEALDSVNRVSAPICN